MFSVPSLNSAFLSIGSVTVKASYAEMHPAMIHLSLLNFLDFVIMRKRPSVFEAGFRPWSPPQIFKNNFAFTSYTFIGNRFSFFPLSHPH